METLLALPSGIASRDTFGDVFARLDAQEFESCFLSWMGAVQDITVGQVIAIDGELYDLWITTTRFYHVGGMGSQFASRPWAKVSHRLAIASRERVWGGESWKPRCSSVRDSGPGRRVARQ